MQKINKIVDQYIFELNVVKFACLLCLLYFVFVHKLFEISLNDNTILVYSKGKKTRRKIKTTINVKKTQKSKNNRQNSGQDLVKFMGKHGCTVSAHYVAPVMSLGAMAKVQ